VVGVKLVRGLPRPALTCSGPDLFSRKRATRAARVEASWSCCAAVSPRTLAARENGTYVLFVHAAACTITSSRTHTTSHTLTFGLTRVGRAVLGIASHSQKQHTCDIMWRRVNPLPFWSSTQARATYGDGGLCGMPLPADKPWAVGCGVSVTLELWRGAAGLCARVLVPPNLYIHTHTCIPLDLTAACPWYPAVSIYI